MKVGLIARGEDRGLGHMTWEFQRAMAPDRTLLIDMGPLGRGFPTHPDRYPGATVARFDGAQLPERIVRPWLDGLDVLYSAETFYDWQVCRWADEAGVATVLHVMPEFHRHHDEGHGLPEPTAWWAPTPWRMDRLPAATRLVPVPVALDRWPTPVMQDPHRPVRILHVAGHRALADRNGTSLFLQALRTTQRPIEVTLSGQDGRLPAVRTPRHIKLASRPSGSADYWSMYADHDLLVMPRRYGGLCLPAQEAMAAGLGLLMPDCPPNSWWPSWPIPARPGGDVRTPCGEVATWTASTTAIGMALGHFSDDRDALAALQARSRAWAAEHSWETLAPVYEAELASAVESRAMAVKP